MHRLNFGSNPEGHAHMMVVEGALVMIQPAAHVEDAQIVRVGRSTVKNCSLTCTMTGLGSTPEHSMVKDHLKSGLIDHGYAHMAIVEVWLLLLYTLCGLASQR
jgi:hypothetical protein